MKIRPASWFPMSFLLMTLCGFAQGFETIADVPVNPLSINGLREFARTVSVEFKPEYERTPIEGIDRRVVSFTVDQLVQFALINELEAPLNIHHSILDLNSTPYYWSIELAGDMYASRKPYFFYSYPGDKHLFDGENLQQAINRDVMFFRSLSTSPTTGSGDG